MKTNNPENLVIFINKDLPGLTRKSSFRHHDGFIRDTNINDRIKYRWSIFTEATPLFCSLANIPIKTARKVTDTITRSNDYPISLEGAYRITDVINSLLIEAKNLVASSSKTHKVDFNYDEASWCIDSMDRFEAVFHHCLYQIMAEFPDKLNSSQSYISVATLFDIISRFNFTFEQPKSIEDINRFLIEKRYVYERHYTQQKTASSLFIASKIKKANLLKLGWYFTDKPSKNTKPSRCEICVGGTVLQEIYDYFGLFK